MHVPIGAHSENGSTGTGDNSACFIDSSLPYKYVNVNDCRIGTNAGDATAAKSVSTTNKFITCGPGNGSPGGMAVQDATGPVLMDAVTNIMRADGSAWENSDNGAGCITYYDLQQCLADPNYVIQHMTAMNFGLNFFNNTFIWPLTARDINGTGPTPEGVIIGIPASTARPAGKSRAFYAVWDLFQHFGGIFNNVTTNGQIAFKTMPRDSATATFVASMNSEFFNVVPFLCILDWTNGVAGAQYNLATLKGRLATATTWSDAFPAPPLLDFSQTGGVSVAPNTFGAWQGSNGVGFCYNVNWESTISAPATPTPTATTTPTPSPTSTSPASTRVVTPLSGTVNTGTWTHSNLSVPMPSGKGLFYSIQYPQGYSKTAGIVYPVIFIGHELDEGMLNGVYPRPGATLVSQNEMSLNFSTVNFRRAYAPILVFPAIDQILDLSGQNGNANGGGYNDSPMSGQNEQAVVSLAKFILSSEAADPTRMYIVGASLGGIWMLAQMADNNAYTGSFNKIWAAGMSFSDQLFRPTVANSTVFPNNINVPIIAVSTGPPGSAGADNNSESYDRPAWRYYTGNSNYPTRSQYDSTGVTAMRAGTSQFYYMDTGTSAPWNTFSRLNADGSGGDGTRLFDLLFSKIAS
jgi:hypothetical protein